MPLWNYPPHRIASLIDPDQYRCLTAQSSETYLAILTELYRSRHEELLHELPFETLYERVAPLDINGVSLERLELRHDLNMLEDWGNVAMRLEPRRIRRIQDWGLERYLVRMTESTNWMLAKIENRLEELEEKKVSSAQFSLLDVDDALQQVIDLLNEDPDHDQYCRAGRALIRARGAIEEAGDELMRLDIWLSETAVQPLQRDRLAELLGQLEAYFRRYLEEVDERRRQCYSKLHRLLDDSASPLLDGIYAAIQKEFSEDPTRQGWRPAQPRQQLNAINEFLEPDGKLDWQRRKVHERLADVAGHLKRYLDEIVRRSERIAMLQAASVALLHAPDTDESRDRMEEIFASLWQSAHMVHDSQDGTPRSQAHPRQPYRHTARSKQRFRGASLRPPAERGPTTERPTIIQSLMDINEFVEKAILRGRDEASVSDALLEDMEDVRLLIASITASRLTRSGQRRNYLKFHTALVAERKGHDSLVAERQDYDDSLVAERQDYDDLVAERQDHLSKVILTTQDGAGRLHLPEILFRRGADR